jgi:signal peptidase I
MERAPAIPGPHDRRPECSKRARGRSNGPAPSLPARDVGALYSPTCEPLQVKRRPLGCLVEIAETLILTLVIFLVIQTFVAQPYRVEQESMRRTLEQDQYVLVDKLTPRFDDYSRGDIIVFHPPGEGEDSVPFIKRVIGVPGDRVEIRTGEVYVNGAVLDEPYVFSGPTGPADGQMSWSVPEGSLFVMGDNRNNSTDSRSSTIGPVPISNVVGRAWLRYWPINTLGILPTPTYPNVPPAEGTSRLLLEPA